MEFTPAFFDEASAAWNMNKKRVGQMYVYICSAEGCNRRATGLCPMHTHKVAPEKKLTHTYMLRSRSQHAPVQPFCNS
jgi:hypothetical protein